MKTLHKIAAITLLFCLTSPAWAQKATGSVMVSITPQGAIDAGAKWRVDGGTWKTSNATVNGLSTGDHEISFKKVTGWKKPKNKTITINASQTKNVTGKYKDKTTTRTPPTADFTADIADGDAGLLVNFSDTSVENGSPITGWMWNFGDPNSQSANQSELQNPSHTYSEPGLYTVSLTLQSAAGSHAEIKQDFILVRVPETKFQSGDRETFVDGTAVVGPAGGTVSGPQNSPIEGVEVFIPAGALAEEVTVTLGFDTGAIPTTLGESSVGALTIDFGGKELLDVVFVSIPFPEAGTGVLVAFRVQLPDGTLEVCPLTSEDESLQTATFATTSGGTFAWVVYDPLSKLKSGNIQPWTSDSKFRAKTNGLSTANVSTTLFPGGRCYGFVSFAQWFFQNRRGVQLNTFNNNVLFRHPTEPGTEPNRPHTIVSSRAMNSIRQSAYDKLFFKLIEVGPNAKWAESMWLTMLVTGQPQVMGLYRPGTDEAVPPHAVLAYQVRLDNGVPVFSVYDSNYPNEEDVTVRILIDPQTQLPSGSILHSKNPLYLKGCLMATPTLRESYENIMADWDRNFFQNTYATITVTSPTQSGKPITTSDVTLAGYVVSGQVLATDLRASVTNDDGLTGPLPIDMHLEATGNPATTARFSATFAQLQPGMNRITFRTTGKLYQGLLAANTGLLSEIELPDNYYQKTFDIPVARHIKLNQSSVNLNSGNNYAAGIVVDSVEPGSSFPLRWKATASDSRISVSPKKSDGTTGNSTSVTISATNTSQPFNGSVTFINLDNPNDTQTVSMSVSVTNSNAPTLQLFHETIALGTCNSAPLAQQVRVEGRWIGAQTLPLRWRASSSDARVSISPSSNSGFQDVIVTISAVSATANTRATITFENLDRADDTEVVPVLVGNPSATDEEIQKRIWGVSGAGSSFGMHNLEHHNWETKSTRIEGEQTITEIFSEVLTVNSAGVYFRWRHQQLFRGPNGFSAEATTTHIYRFSGSDVTRGCDGHITGANGFAEFSLEYSDGSPETHEVRPISWSSHLAK